MHVGGQEKVFVYFEARPSPALQALKFQQAWLTISSSWAVRFLTLGMEEKALKRRLGAHLFRVSFPGIWALVNWQQKLVLFGVV